MMHERAGVLPVDKPEGPTSHDVVAAARRALRLRRIGHTGTLDPFASGLLLLCLGRATRLAEYLGTLDKAYRASMRLGRETDTDDATGAVVAESGDWTGISRDEVRAALARQTGEIEQTPPAFSAKKVEGRRAYRMARSGSTPELAPARVRVDAIRLVRFAPPDADFEVTCGSGTYIRAIARDVGRALGVGAHLTGLRRTAIGSFTVEQALPTACLDDGDAVANAWIEPIDAVRHLPHVEVHPDQVPIVTRGGAIPATRALRPGPVALTAQGVLLAIGVPQGDRIQPRKVLA